MASRAVIIIMSPACAPPHEWSKHSMELPPSKYTATCEISLYSPSAASNTLHMHVRREVHLHGKRRLAPGAWHPALQ